MALDKESKTLGKKQYHIHLKPGDIGKYVLLPGDPARSLQITANTEPLPVITRESGFL